MVSSMMLSRIADGGANSARLTPLAYSSQATMRMTNVTIRTVHTPVRV